jgi:hypothetical protein
MTILMGLSAGLLYLMSAEILVGDDVRRAMEKIHISRQSVLNSTCKVYSMDLTKSILRPLLRANTLMFILHLRIFQ